MPELKHHGVKGMRWGIRRSREERNALGMSKRKLQKSFYKKRQDFTKGKMPGEATRKVGEKYQKEVDIKTKALRKKLISKFEETATNMELHNANKIMGYNKMAKEYQKKFEKSNKEFTMSQKEYNKVVKIIARDYKKEFTKAILKDIGVKDIDRGSRLVDDMELRSKHISEMFAYKDSFFFNND